MLLDCGVVNLLIYLGGLVQNIWAFGCWTKCESSIERLLFAG